MKINSDEDDKIYQYWMDIVKQFPFDPYCRQDADADSYLAESLVTTRITADP